MCNPIPLSSADLLSAHNFLVKTNLINPVVNYGIKMDSTALSLVLITISAQLSQTLFKETDLHKRINEVYNIIVGGALSF